MNINIKTPLFCKSLVLVITLLFAINSANAEVTQKMLDFKLGDKTVDFKLTTPKRCIFGDFDLIQRDMSYAKNPRLIASATRADSKSTSVYTELLKELSAATPQTDVEKIVAGLNTNGYDFSLPASFFKDAGTYLLQICKDSENSNTCATKKFRDFAEMFAEYEEPRDPEKYTPQDNLYYQVVIVSNGKGKIFYPGFAIEDKNIAILANFLEKEALSSAETTNALASAAKLMSTNLEYEQSSGKLVVALPEYDAKKCGQEQAQQ